MTLTLRSSTSFISLKDIKRIKTLEDFSGTVSFAQIKPTPRRLRERNSLQDAQSTHEKITSPFDQGMYEQREKFHALSSSQHEAVNHSRVPVYVMLPLDTVTLGGHLNKPKAMNASFMALKSAGVEGVMVDVWWGLVEKDGPLKYNWEGYVELVNMVQKHGLKLQAVMSFHQCGGNVGDSCRYTIRERKEIQVGMGPCGELRYPSYPESNGTWRFPGIGEFQCYDKVIVHPLVVQSKGEKSGPHDSGQYNQFPGDTIFFKRDGTWDTDYGRFFLEWYSGKLLQHGDRIMRSADSIFRGTGAKLSAKVAGIHWHYKTRSHAAELTAGYYNTRHSDGYLPIAKMVLTGGVSLAVKQAVKAAGIELAGENALERYDDGANRQVQETSRSDSGNGLCAFTFLRMNKRLFEADNWRELVNFVRSMSEGGRVRLPESDTSRTDLYVRFVDQKTKSLKGGKEAVLV
ncbi:hypothetical protein L1987_72157 [Smallanthus sonchifolius]|uniref:Uncharacterized protein n=1 Tax=Smallanthus sonchifolius TaxID=185202 RepID=A0ACB9AUQ7_9ASTR|nr:hypothetical protein L1987_72157 [Smallanthus sonchifolius]